MNICLQCHELNHEFETKCYNCGSVLDPKQYPHYKVSKILQELKNEINELKKENEKLRKQNYHSYSNAI